VEWCIRKLALIFFYHILYIYITTISHNHKTDICNLEQRYDGRLLRRLRSDTNWDWRRSLTWKWEKPLITSRRRGYVYKYISISAYWYIGLVEANHIIFECIYLHTYHIDHDVLLSYHIKYETTLTLPHFYLTILYSVSTSPLYPTHPIHPYTHT